MKKVLWTIAIENYSSILMATVKRLGQDDADTYNAESNGPGRLVV